ncbi:hypothetical protein AB4308_18720 [Vibrio breoganii]
MSKFCIFCGAKPKDKSREHIIPQWLIELTGDPKRDALFGFMKDNDNFGKPRKYPFKHFTFPACTTCNTTHGKLEALVKPVVQKILNEISVTSEELSCLMDWVDKVRVGLWLGMQQLDKNYLDVESNFHIEKRIGQYDRLLIVQKTDRRSPRISFSSIDTPAFSFTPSAFSITINNFNFISISSAFLFARRIGFPYVTDTVLSPDSDQYGATIVKGRERLMMPLIRKPMSHNGVVIYQPQYRNGMIDGDFSIYDCDYVKNHSLDFEQGDGNLFIEHKGRIAEYSNGDSIASLQNLPCNDDEKLSISSAIEVLKWQNWFHTQIPDTRLLSSDQKLYIKDKFNFATKVNQSWINALQKML